jgi:hypothetical protein
MTNTKDLVKNERITERKSVSADERGLWFMFSGFSAIRMAQNIIYTLCGIRNMDIEGVKWIIIQKIV